MQYAIGIDMGGTFIKYALINSEGDFLHTGKVPTVVPGDSTLSQLVTAIGHALTYAQQNNLKVEGVGVGSPGVIVDGVIVGGAENIPGWEGINIEQEVKSQFNLPAKAENDANVMGLGEFAYGAGKDAEDVVFLTIGTGIGSAFILNGKLFSGFQNRGSEFGHTPLFADGEICACGATGCVETYASTAALVRDYQKQLKLKDIATSGDINGEYIISKYTEGEPLAKEIMGRHFYYLGRAIAGLVNVFSPQLIVIGGGIAECGAFYTERILEEVKKQALPISCKDLKIQSALLGNKAGSMGAAYLVFNK